MGERCETCGHNCGNDHWTKKCCSFCHDQGCYEQLSTLGRKELWATRYAVDKIFEEADLVARNLEYYRIFRIVRGAVIATIHDTMDFFKIEAYYDSSGKDAQNS